MYRFIILKFCFVTEVKHRSLWIVFGTKVVQQISQELELILWPVIIN